MSTIGVGLPELQVPCRHLPFDPRPYKYQPFDVFGIVYGIVQCHRTAHRVAGKDEGSEIHHFDKSLYKLPEAGRFVDSRALGLAVTGQIDGQRGVIPFEIGILVHPDSVIVKGAVDQQNVVSLTDAGLGLRRKLIVDVSAFDRRETHGNASAWMCLGQADFSRRTGYT